MRDTAMGAAAGAAVGTAVGSGSGSGSATGTEPGLGFGTGATATVDEAEARLLRRLLAALDPDGPGRPLLLLVEGAAGTGKSRLVRRLAAAVPAPVRRTTVDEPLPVIDEPLPAASDAGGAHGPVLLVAEDVHRAPGDVTARLRALLAAPPARLVCVLTYRPEELAAPGLVLGPDTEFPAALGVVRHVLGPLGVPAVRRMAEEALGAARCPAALPEELHRATGGLAQTVADLLDLIDVPDQAGASGTSATSAPSVPSVPSSTTGPSGTLGSSGSSGSSGPSGPSTAPVPLEPPPRLVALVQRRIAALPEEQRPIVFAAAVLDEPASSRDLAAVAGLDAAAGRAALAAALRTAALVELGDGHYGFDAPLAAAAARPAASGPTREALHRAAARVLGRRRPVDWERVAAHRRACGDREGWLHAVEAAARHYEDEGGLREAVALLESALDGGPVPRHARPRLALQLARCAVVGLWSDATLRVLRLILDDRDLPTGVRGEIRLDLGLLQCNHLDQVAEGRVELVRAVRELEGRPAPLARAMSVLAMPYRPGASFTECVGWIERAVAVAEESGDPVVRAAVTSIEVCVLMSVGDRAAWEVVDRLPRDSELVACRQQAARGLCNAADAAMWLGHYARSRALLGEGRALAVRSGAVYVERTGHGCALLLDWATGDWCGLTERALAFAEEVGSKPYVVTDARTVLGLLALSRGDWAELGAHLCPESVDLDTSPVPVSAAVSGALIRFALARHDLAAAATQAAAAWQRLRAKAVWAWAAELAPWAVEAMLRAGHAAAACAMAEEFAAGLTGRDAPSAAAALLWTRALLAEHEGRTADARAGYEASAAAYRALPRAYHEALTAERAAHCAFALGDCAAAVTVLVDRAAVFDGLGATWDAARVRAGLRLHRPDEPRRTPGRPCYGDLLSPREAEVAELVVAGMSNREIAAKLHLSPRTVEQHVGRAMQKTGVRSRQQLARALEELAG